METTLRFADLAIIFATLAGPIFAVQAQKWLERGREINGRRMAIFRTLMATRANRLTQAHVEALNATPIEFYGKSSNLRPIIQAWRLYMEHLSNYRQMSEETWVLRREDLFTDLLQSMANRLGYNFDKTQLKREIYSPTGHEMVERDQEAIRQGLAKLLTGQRPLELNVKTMPVDDELRKLVTDWLSYQDSASRRA